MPVPINKRDEKKKRGPRQDKIPAHLTKPETRAIIAKKDHEKKLRQFKKLEKESCCKSALELQSQMDKKRREADKSGSPMRMKQSSVQNIKRVWGEEATEEVLKKQTVRRTVGRKPPRYPPPPKIAKISKIPSNPKL